MEKRFFEWLLRHRWLVLMGWVALIAAALFASRGVRTDYDVTQFFPAWDPARVTYERYKVAFPKEDAQFVLFWREERPPDVEFYQAIENAARIFEDAGLDDVRWFGNVKVADNLREAGESTLRIHELIENHPESDEELRELLAQHRDDPLYRNLVWNQDQTVFSVVGHLPLSKNTDEERRRVDAELSERLASFESEGRHLALTGIPYMRSQVLEILEGELGILLGIALMGLLALMYWFLRSILQVLLSLAAILPAYLITMGAMGLFDWPVTALTSFLAIIVLVMGFSDSIHVLTHYRVVRAAGLGHDEAIVQSFAELAGPCFYTSLTTAVGFLSLLSTRIDIVVDFALVTALALMLTYAAAILFLPVLLSFGPSSRPLAGALHARWLERWIRFAARTSRERAGPILIACGAMLALFGWLGMDVRVNAYMADLLKRDHELIRDIRWVESQGFGLFQVDVFLESSNDRPLHDVEILAWIEALRRELEKDPLVVKTLALGDYLKQVRRGVLDGRADAYRMPDSTEEAAQLLLLAETSDPTFLEDVYLQASNEAQLVILVQDLGSAVTLPFLARLDAALERNPPPEGVGANVTGTVKLAQTAYGQLTAGFAWSLVIAVGLIFGIMVVIFRSPRWGVVALVPNLVPLLLLLGLFGLLELTIKPSLAMVFAITFGVAVDDTIHMLGMLRRLRAQGCRREELVRQALASSGRAIVITSLVIGVGFLFLLASVFQWIAVLGGFTAVALFAALLANLFVLPALIHCFALVES